MTDIRQDGFLGGRLRIAQPARGYRSGADAVMLAAACPAQAGQTVLELGCGAGVASLCLGWRVPGVVLAGIERQPDYAALARDNAQGNGINLSVHEGALEAMPEALRARSFDHVIANPPYFTGGTAGPDAGRAIARQEKTPLELWLDVALKRLKPGGSLSFIQRADRLDGLISALGTRAGGIVILPIAARVGREAGRIILTARKGTRAPLRLLAPFVMHESARHLRDAEDLTAAASAVLREGAALTSLFAKD